MADFEKETTVLEGEKTPVEGEKEELEQKDSEYIKCESCGSNMTFDPLTQTLKCDYCGNSVDFSKNSNVKEIEIEHAFEQSEKWQSETFSYRCENCGANFVIGSDEVAVSCPYCSTSHIVKTEDISGIKPSAVFPFLLDKASAVASSKKWAKKRIFAPRSFKKNLEEHNIHGIYLPCFTFDSRTDSVYDGKLGERCTRTVKRNGKTYTETYIKWHYVRGTFRKFYDDLMITAGDMKQGDLDKINTFKRETLCVYEKKFLSGFTASHYTRDIKTCWRDAKNIIDADLRTSILHSYGYDVIGYLNVSTNHSNVTYKYVLLPVYRLNYKFKKKEYPVTINGNSGKVAGKAPVSPLRVLIAVVLGIALLGLLFFILSGDSATSAIQNLPIY